MAISVESWRIRIGCFRQFASQSALESETENERHPTPRNSTSRMSGSKLKKQGTARFPVLIVTLLPVVLVAILVIGCVETNPGPPPIPVHDQHITTITTPWPCTGSHGSGNNGTSNMMKPTDVIVGPKVVLKMLTSRDLLEHGISKVNDDSGYKYNMCDHDQSQDMHLHLSASDESDQELQGGNMNGYMTDSNAKSPSEKFDTSGYVTGGDPVQNESIGSDCANERDDIMNGWITDVGQASAATYDIDRNGFMTDINDVMQDDIDRNGFMTDINDVVQDDIDRNGFMTDINDVMQDDIDRNGFMTDINDVVQDCANEREELMNDYMTDIGQASAGDSDQVTGFMTDINDIHAVEGWSFKKKRRVRFAEPQSSSSESSGESGVDSFSDGENIHEENQPTRQQAKQSSRIYPLSIVKTLNCCARKCLNLLLATDSYTAASKARKRFCGKILKEQADWVKDYLADHHVNSDGKYLYRFVVGLEDVCRTAWMQVIGLTKSRFYVLKKAFEAGRVLNLKSNCSKVETHNCNVNKSMAWLALFANEFGDQMPDSKNINLPSSLTKNDTYERMCTELREQGDQPCSRDAFFKNWKKDFSNITIPKENRFSRCNKCTKYKLKLQTIKDKEQRKIIQAKRDKHIKFQNAERRKYYTHIFKAKNEPEKYMSLIVDGMDQNTTSLPRPLFLSKFSSAMWKLTCHLVGVIVHGKSNHVFVDMGEIPQDSNSTCNILLQTLKKYEGHLPPVLYIQMDNCARENKNQYVFGLCCALVELKIFQKIKVSFLPVGHTHEDVDQYFSRISVHLSKFSVPTLSRLLSLIKTACPKIRCTVERLVNTYDIKKWLSPCLSPIQNHSQPHVFKFTRNEEGKAVMRTRMWASKKEKWTECSTDGTCSYLLNKHPEGYPDSVKPDLEPLKLSKLLQDIKRAVNKELINGESLTEWKDLVKQLQEEERTEDSSGTFPLYDLIPYSAQQHITENAPSLGEERESSSSDPSPEVNLGRKRKRSKPVQKDDMVCVYNTEFLNEWPQVGQVVDITESSLTVRWYCQKKDDGTFDPMYLTKGIKRVPYTSTMSMSCVITQPFNLTARRRIPKKINAILDTKFHNYFEKTITTQGMGT